MGGVQIFINSVVSKHVFDVAPGFRVGDGFDKDVPIRDVAKSGEPGPQHFWPGVVGDQNMNSIPFKFSIQVVQISNSQADVDFRFEQEILVKGLVRMGPGEQAFAGLGHDLHQTPRPGG